MSSIERWDVANPERVKSLLSLEQKTSLEQMQKDGLDQTCENIESDLMEVIAELLHQSQDERHDPLLDLASKLFKTAVDVRNLPKIVDGVELND